MFEKFHGSPSITMSDSYRRDRGAFAALLVSLVAIVLVCWIAAWSSHQADKPKATNDSHSAAPDNRGPSEGYWWPEFSARDTYAQWAAAFLSLVSTFISIWAVKLVRDTLVLNRAATEAAINAAIEADRANEIARHFGELQTRAYVAVGSIKISGLNVERQPTAYFKIRNVGQTPAHAVQVSFGVDYVVGELGDHRCIFGDENRWTAPFDLYPNGESDMNRILPQMGFYQINAIMEKKAHLIMFGTVRYRDVFKRRRRVVFSAMLAPESIQVGNGIFTPTPRHNRSN